MSDRVGSPLSYAACARRRFAALHFHCTAPGAAAARNGAFRTWLLAAALLLTVLGLLAVWTAPASAQANRTWRALFDLQPGATYTYTLMYEPQSGVRRLPEPWWAPPGWPEVLVGRSGQRTVVGQLNLYRTGGAFDEVRFWFVFGDVRVSGTAPVDPQAVAGAVLVAALTGPEPLPDEAARLLATVFQWTAWRDSWARSTFRDGTVWETVQNPPYRFTARQRGISSVYDGQLTLGREVVLEMTIDLGQPLPLEIVSYAGNDRYRAVLEQQPGSGPRR